MQHVLNRLCQMAPGRVLLWSWLAYLTGATAVSLVTHPLTTFFAFLIGLTVMVGYSIVVLLGAPTGSASARNTGRAAAAALVVLSLLVALDDAGASQFGRLRVVEGVAVVLIFASSFVATHAIGEVRRAAGLYKPTDFIGTWLALFCFSFGGAFLVHRQVQEVIRGESAAVVTR